MSFNLINLILNNLSSEDIKLDKNITFSKNSSNNFDSILFEILQNKLTNFPKKEKGDIAFFHIFKESEFFHFFSLNSLEEIIKRNLNKISNVLNKKTLSLKDLKLLKKYISDVLKDLRLITEKKDKISMESLNKYILGIFNEIKNILNLDFRDNNEILDIKITQELKKTAILKKKNLSQIYLKTTNEFIETEKIFNQNEEENQKNELKNIISFLSLLYSSLSEIISEINKKKDSYNLKSQKDLKVSFSVSKYIKSNKDNDNYLHFDKDLNEKVSKNLLEKNLKVNFDKTNKDSLSKLQDQNRINYQKIFESSKNENVKNILENNLHFHASRTEQRKKNNNNLISSSENLSLRKKAFLNEIPKSPNKNLDFYLKDNRDLNKFSFENLSNNSKTKLENLATISNFSKKIFPNLDKDRNQKVEKESNIDNNLNLNSNLDKQNSIIKNYANAQDIKVGKTNFIISEQKFPNLKVLNVYQNQENLLKVRYHLATGELALILKVENMPPLTLQLIKKEIESILDNHSIFKRRVRIKNEKREKESKENEKASFIISKRI